MRFAVFFAPPPDHPLWKAASLWLGRDAASGEHIGQFAGGGFSEREIRGVTESPRRYGFHATLRPPFHLAGGRMRAEVDAVLDDACRSLAPIALPRLAVTRIGSFFALSPSAPAAGLDRLAGDIVRRFHDLCAPPDAAEISRRRPDTLSPRQRANLERWGYPYVFEDYRFHMTLTGPVSEERAGAMKRLLETRFEPVLDHPIAVDALCLFVEPQPPGDFHISRREPLSAQFQTSDAL